MPCCARVVSFRKCVFLMVMRTTFHSALPGCEVHLAALGRENKRLSEENASLKQLLSHSKNSEEECQRQLSSIFSAYNALQQHMKTVMEKAKVSSCLNPCCNFSCAMTDELEPTHLRRIAWLVLELQEIPLHLGRSTW